MKLHFPTHVRRSNYNNFTFITLGRVVIGFHGSTVMYVEDKTADEAYVYEGLNSNNRPYIDSIEVSASVLAFHLNRILHAQADKILNQAMDRILTEKDTI